MKVFIKYSVAPLENPHAWSPTAHPAYAGRRAGGTSLG